MTSKQRVWILEDDTGAQFVYREVLGARYDLEIFGTIAEFRARLEALPSDLQNAPALLIADLRLPDDTFLSYLTRNGPMGPLAHIPFMVVSSVDDTDILRQCFQKGAVDYLTKPFSKGELVVKLERIFAHQTAREKGESVEEFVRIDPVSLTISIGSEISPPLTSKEYQILTLLNRAPDHIISRADILSRVWSKVSVSAKTLDVHLFNLRKKLAVVGLEIQFVPPSSYKLLDHAHGTTRPAQPETLAGHSPDKD